MNNSLSLRFGNLLISLSLNDQARLDPENVELNNLHSLALNERASSKLTAAFEANGSSAKAEQAKVDYLGELRRRLL